MRYKCHKISTLVEVQAVILSTVTYRIKKIQSNLVLPPLAR